MIQAMLLAAVLAAPQESIIPIVGVAEGHDALHIASATVFNPTPRTAIVRRTGTFPLREPSAECSFPETWSIPPYSIIGIGKDELVCSGVVALSIAYDEPLVVRNQMGTQFFSLGLFDRVQIDVPAQWIEAGVESVLSAQVEPNFGYRANLLLINPNDVPITVHLIIERPEARTSREESVEVPPHSLRLHPIGVIEIEGPFVLDGIHNLRVVADGRYWAGASSLNYQGGNSFSKAIPLEP